MVYHRLTSKQIREMYGLTLKPGMDVVIKSGEHEGKTGTIQSFSVKINVIYAYIKIRGVTSVDVPLDDIEEIKGA